MLAELISAAAEAVFGYFLEQSGLAEEAKTRLARDPHTLALQTVLANVLASITPQYPELTTQLFFDQHFLTHSAAPLLARALTRDGKVEPEELAGAWAIHVGLQGEAGGRAVAEVLPVVVMFLDLFCRQTRNGSTWQALWDSRSLDATAQATARTAEAARRTADAAEQIERRLTTLAGEVRQAVERLVATLEAIHPTLALLPSPQGASLTPYEIGISDASRQVGTMARRRLIQGEVGRGTRELQRDTEQRELPLELIEQMAKGNVTLFIGEGVSQMAGLPAWADITGRLAVELEDSPPSLNPREIARYYELEYERHSLLKRLRDELDTESVDPSPVHLHLAHLPVFTILTTTHDDLLERALITSKRRKTVIAGNSDVDFWSEERVRLVKLYGNLNRPLEGSQQDDFLTLTTDDYEHFAQVKPRLSHLLTDLLRQQTVLFIGYAGDDPDFRMALAQARSETGRLTRNLFTIQFGPSRLMVKDLERRGLKVINLGAHPSPAEQASTLLNWLQALEEQVAEAQLRSQAEVATARPATAVEVLGSEIQVWLTALGFQIGLYTKERQWLDWEATLERGLDEQHVLVRCVAGEITVSHLESLATILITAGVPKGWIVSDRRIPPSTLTAAHDYPGIRAFSLAEFVSEIFGPYFVKLRRLVEEGDIPQYYVDLSCYRRVLDSKGKEIGRDHYEVIDSYLDDWLKARDANHLSILGEFGSGKTWFCRHYAYRQLGRYLNDPVQERLPILITLRDYVKQVELGSLIRKLFEEEGVRLSGSLEAFHELNRRGKLLLIFDGFDEMALKVDYQMVVDYFWELAKVLEPQSKALLTSRTGYFRYATEAERVLYGEERGRQMIVVAPPKFEVLYLSALSDKQIREIITRRSDAQTAATILNYGGLKELIQQPVLIEMLMESLDLVSIGPALTKTLIYYHAVDKWLERDIKSGTTFMSKEDKLFFMQELAWEMLTSGKLKIHYKDLPTRIGEHFGLSQPYERDYYDYDIRTKSLLRRDAFGYYEFAHKSVVEFLAALKVVRELEGNSFDILRDATFHSGVFWEFLRDLAFNSRINVIGLIERITSRTDYIVERDLIRIAGYLSKDEVGATLINILTTPTAYAAYEETRYRYESRPLREIVIDALGSLSPDVIPLIDVAIERCTEQGKQRRVGAWQARKALQRARKMILKKHGSNS